MEANSGDPDQTAPTFVLTFVVIGTLRVKFDQCNVYRF